MTQDPTPYPGWLLLPLQKLKPILCPVLFPSLLEVCPIPQLLELEEYYYFYETSSFSESKARNLIKEAGNEFVQHNIWQLSQWSEDRLV